MEWFVEKHDGTAFMIKIYEKLYESKNFQKIEIYSTSMGKMLVLDGKIQFTQADEMMYHEMLVHVPAMMHPKPEKFLIIGGGDGGAAREALKHEPESVTIVEIDRNVVESCRKYVGIDDGALNDRRVEIVHQDGREFVEKAEEHYDIAIIDGTDPNIFSSHISGKKFYMDVMKIADVLATQSQSPFFQKKYFMDIVKNSLPLKNRRFYISYMPSYPSGMWSFMIAGDYDMDEERVRKRYVERKIETRHYNPDIHFASFSLPNWMKEMLK